MKKAINDAWKILKQYDPMQPAHMRSQVFPVGKQPATTRMMMPHERQERILADRDQAMERANQFHQDRIDAMKVLPEPTTSFSQGGPDFNPFKPVGRENTMRLSPPQREYNIEQVRLKRLKEMARDAVRQGQFSASYDQNPATMDALTRSMFDVDTQRMMDLHEQSRKLPMQTFQSGGK